MTKLKPFAVADGEGRAYEWHDVVFTMKAAARETGGALALWEITTKPGEEPHMHVHEMFYVLSGSITFRVGRKSVRVEKGGFAFVPLGTPHTYVIHSRKVRMLGLSTPSDFGDHIEKTGRRRAKRQK
jgi:mannose-6-phosphate isomerase-like protein (cupin superfamily)